MSTAEDFLLIATDPESGKTMFGAPQSDPVLGGAFLLDLVATGRLTLEGKDRKARVVVADRAPVDNPVVALAFARVVNKGRLTPQKSISTMGKQSKKVVYDALLASGTLRRRPAKALGIFPLTRYDFVDASRRDDLLARIRASLLYDQPADAETGPLIGLLSAADLTKIIVDKPDRKRAKARAKVLADGDWATEAVRKAVKAAQAAMSGVIAASTAASIASS
ncbi:MAG: hypothetical protein JWQ70_2147 [Aeromicrobium sp.]|nr:hypothetical protein [Aeromicrobium sp.]